MSCKDCDEFQDNKVGSYYFRWGTANIELRACEFHTTQVFDTLKRELARLQAMGRTLEQPPEK